MPGSGKSTIGFELARKLHRRFIDSDDYLEFNEKTSIKNLFEVSESHFREVESKYLEELSQKTNLVLSTGGGAVTIDKNMEHFKDDIVIFINRPIDMILSDISTEKRPLLQKDVKEELINIYKNRIKLYEKFSNFEIINDCTVSDALEKIMKII